MNGGMMGMMPQMPPPMPYGPMTGNPGDQQMPQMMMQQPPPGMPFPNMQPPN